MSKETIYVSIDVLKVHPRNTEFFDDIAGKDYEDFKNSIKEEGIISDIIVAPDMTIISGHQRCKAAKELGLQTVPIRVREDLVDEDKKLKVLLAANFGRSKNDEKKKRKVAVEYVKLCGYEQGGDRKSKCQNGTLKLSLEEIASQLGTSKRDLQRALSIERNLTDSMKELLDTGVITKTLAADTVASLTSEEQEELITKLDVTKKYTQKQVKQYIEEIKRLEDEKQKLEKKNKDFGNNSSMSDTVSKLKRENQKLETEKNILEAQVKISDELAAKYKSESEEYMEVKKKLVHMGLEPDGEYNTFQASVQITELNSELSDLLKNRLAPIKYQPYIYAVKNNELLRNNFLRTLHLLRDWYSEMLSYFDEEDITKTIVDIEMEEK